MKVHKNTWYFSDSLSQKFPKVWSGLQEILNGHEINYNFESIAGIDIRNQKPLQVNTNKYIKLKNQQLAGLPFNQDTNVIVAESNLDLNISNIELGKKKVILPVSIFSQNPDFTPAELIEKVKVLFEVDVVIILPISSDQQRLPVRFIDDEKVFFCKGLADVENDGIRSALYSGGLKVIEVESPAFLDYLLVEQLIIIPQKGKKPIESVVNVLEQYYPGHKIEYINCEQLSAEGFSLQDVSWQRTRQEDTGIWEELFEKKYKEIEEQLIKEMSAIDQADDGLNPIHKKQQMKFEFARRRNLLFQQSISKPENPYQSYSTQNSFKEQVLKEFYYEWTADEVNQKYLKNKVTHFMLQDLPRLRTVHRIQMQTNQSNYEYSFQPEFIDASIMKIVKIIAEYTAYQECIEKIEAYQKKEEQTSKEENQLPYNSSMLVLFFHFFLKSIGVDMGQAIKGNIARFIHLLFNLNYVSLTKTKKIYDKVRASPLVVEDSTLVGYLAEAKNTFLKFDLKDASLMVDEYLTESIKEKNKKN